MFACCLEFNLSAYSLKEHQNLEKVIKKRMANFIESTNNDTQLLIARHGKDIQYVDVKKKKDEREKRFIFTKFDTVP